MIMREVFTNTVYNGQPQLDNSGLVGPSGYPGSNLTTDASGQNYDAPFGGCDPQSVSLTETQTIHIIRVNHNGDYLVRVNNFSLSSTSSGHGNITNGGDISASR